MANIKFTEFPSAATVGAMDIIPIVQDGANKKATAAVFQTYIGSLFVGLAGTQTITGSKTFTSPIISSVVTGSAPFTVASTTKVTNLNADLLDGLSSAAFQTVLTNPITGTGTTNYLPKFTGASALGNSLVYDDGTNVGIGTTTPDRALTVNGQISLNGDLISTKGGTTFRIGYESYTATGGVNMFTESAVPLVLGTTSTERMRITSAGNVGIGNTSPTNALDIYNTTTNARINIQGTTNPVLSQYTNSSGPLYIGIDDSTGANYTGTPYARFIYSAFNYPLAIFTDTVERMRITGTGNVGIGTTTPAYKFVASNNGALGLEIDPTSNSGTQVEVLTYNRSAGAYKPLKFNSEEFGFITASTERLTIKNNGNVLIGTTTDSGYKLDVNGSARVSGALGINGAVYGGTVLTLQESGALGAALAMTNRNSNQTWGFAVDTAAVDDKNFGIFNFTGGNFPLIINATTSASTFSGAVAINNPVNAAVAVASTHKVTIVIGGVTYYLLASNV